MRLRDEEGKWHDLSGGPLVLAHVDSWKPNDVETAALTAQLRGLGGHLLVIARAGATLLGPDGRPKPVRVPVPAGPARGVRIMDEELQTCWLSEAPLAGTPAFLVHAIREAAQRRRAMPSLQPSGTVTLVA